MSVVIRPLRSPFHQRNELIAHIDKSRASPAAPQFKRKDASVKGQRLVDVPNLQRDVIDAHHMRFRFLVHTFSLKKCAPVSTPE
jgi:hypothetical protein